MVNKVILVGRVGGDVAVRTIGENKVAEFSFATSEKFKDKDGVRQEKTEWHNIVMWRGLAGVAERYVAKGSLLYLEGKKETQTWDKDGVTQYKTIIVCHDMKMLGGKSAESVGADPITPVGSGADENDLPF